MALCDYISDKGVQRHKIQLCLDVESKVGLCVCSNKLTGITGKWTQGKVFIKKRSIFFVSGYFDKPDLK